MTTKDPPPEPAGIARRQWRLAGALFLLAFALYTFTLAPGLMPGDTGDMVLGAATFAEAHPPGYPLYALLGKVFAALPIEDIPYRVNLMAAFLGGLAVALVFLAVLHLTRHVVASAATALLFGCSSLFWTYFVLAEAFCLNNFFLALTAFLALYWRERHRQNPGSAAERKTLRILVFLAGLGLGNHQTLVLVFPGLLAFVAVVDRTALRPRRLLSLAGCLALGAVLPYLYLPVAAHFHPDHFWEDTGTLRGLLRLVLRKQYGTLQLSADERSPALLWAQVEGYLGSLATCFLWPGFLAGLAGAVILARRDRAAFALSAGGFALGVAFLLYANLDPRPTAFDRATIQRFYMLPHFFFLLWIGAGLAALAQHIAGRSGRLSGLATALLLALPAVLFAVSLPRAGQRGNRVYPRFVANVLDSLPANAVLLSWTDEIGIGVRCAQEAQKRRPDVTLVVMGLAGTEPYTSTLRRRHPDMVWPPNKARAIDLDGFLRQNLARRRIFRDDLAVKGATPSVTVPHGLLYEVRGAGAGTSVREVVETNEALWGRQYDLRQVDARLYPPDSMCFSVVVFYYLARRFHLAREYNRFGHFAEALRHLEACRTMDGHGYVALSPDWHRETARAQIGLKRPREALPHLDAARGAEPGNADTYALLSLAYAQMGDAARAREFAAEFARRRR